MLEKAGIPIFPYFSDEKVIFESELKLIEKLQACKKCSGFVDNKQFPFLGSFDSEICFINGVVPSDRTSLVGSGQIAEIFRQYLRVLGKEEDNVFVTNLVFCSGVRRLTEQSFFNCLDFHKQVFSGLSKLKVVFSLGSMAFQLTGLAGRGSIWIGKYFEYKVRDRIIKFVPLNHPGEIVHKPEVWEIAQKVLVDVKAGLDL